MEEVYELLKIVEEAGRHGETFKHIRAEATRRLLEIEAGFAPEKPEEEYVGEPDGVTEDNPTPAKREPAGDGLIDDVLINEPDEVAEPVEPVVEVDEPFDEPVTTPTRRL